MLNVETQFPHAGCIAFRRGTAEPARIIRHNADRTALIERRQRLPGGGTTPLPGAAANCTVPMEDLHADEDSAIFGSTAKARAARRSRAAGGR